MSLNRREAGDTAVQRRHYRLEVIGVAGGSDLAAVRAVLQWSLEAHGGGAPTLQFGVASTRRSGISAID